MDDIYYQKVLNRIIQGRLRLRLGDLVLFIHEPTQEIIEESFDIYDQYYEKAYFSGVYIQEEITELLIENDLWNPVEERNIEKLKDRIENLKVQAYENFHNKRKLMGTKRQIRATERDLGTLMHKKVQFDHMSCGGVASFARRSWIIEKTTKNTDGSDFDFSRISCSAIMDRYSDATIETADFRKVARSEPWRSVWITSKKRGDAFGRSASELDQNQLALCTFSVMYDNVHESPESPQEDIIEDDDCLDGWFTTQRRKYEKDKKQRQVDDLIKNDKIKNSQEVFLMADNMDQAKEILDLNDPHSRNILNQRNAQIRQTDGNLHIRDIHDIKLQNQMDRVQATKTKMGKMSKGGR